MPQIIVKLRKTDSMGACCRQLKEKNKSFKAFHSLNAVHIPLDEGERVQELVDPDLVERIDEDITLHLIEDRIIRDSDNAANSSTREVPWGMTRIGAKYARIPQKYARPKIAVLDTGLSKHPSSNVAKKFANFSTESAPQDQSGHGTHIGGSIAGFTPNQKQKQHFHGVFPSLSLLSVKAFSSEGTAPLSAIIQSIEWCMLQNVHIINMSFGVDRHNDTLYEVIQAAHEKGILMVAASGNDGRPGLKYPARYPQVISVGSINADDQVSTFSQFGTNLDVVAPGEEIFSTWINREYRTLSGTSMACAHVTGTLGLMLALQPDLEHTVARQILIESTEPLTTSRLLQGNGLISISNVIQRLRK